MERFVLGALAIGWILLGPIPAWEDGRPILTKRVASADIRYVHDRIGRLIGVVDPAGDTAVYHYDAVGNLTSISRQSSALVSIIDFFKVGLSLV
jgi:YD repeat-containing protein